MPAAAEACYKREGIAPRTSPGTWKPDAAGIRASRQAVIQKEAIIRLLLGCSVYVVPAMRVQ